MTSAIESNEITVGIFVDLAKAFDTVNHNILLSKLHHYGIRGIPHEWFKSYLNGRSQYVYINGINSDYLPIKCGVPQGSILGPLLFLLYINDLSSSTKILRCIMFADDTNMFVSGKNLTSLISIINTELDKINTWFCANLLSLNVKKTNYILFANKRLPNIDIFINKQAIARVYETKFLGVIIQYNLKWHAHINLIQNKISKTVGIMSKIKSILATPHLRILYQRLIEPYLTYSCIIWASSEKNTHLEVLHKLQKRAVRIILNAQYTAHSKPLFYKLNILNIYDICLSYTVQFTYKSLNHLLPTRYNSYFMPLKDLHLYYTRNSKSNLFLLNAQKSCRINSLRVRAPKLWNSLPVSIRNIPTFKRFKSSLKIHLLSYYNS